MGILHGLVFALIFGAAGAVLSCVRYKNRNIAGAAIGSFTAIFILVLLEDWAVHTRPVTTFAGLLPLILLNLLTVLIVVMIADGIATSLSLATVVSFIALLALSIVWLNGWAGGHGQPVPCPAGAPAGQHCIKEAAGIVPVTEFSSDTLPASSTSNLVIVTADEAATRASQAMSSGIAASRNFSSYLDLGPATLQMIDGTMWYAFGLQFQGHLNKSRLGAVEPGYILVNAQDPNAQPVERYDGPYSMIVSLAAGQGAEPDRWAYDHGYSAYELDDPTLEIADSGVNGVTAGAPFWTVTLLAPQTGWTFQAPVGVLLINAHTGEITRYAIPGRPAAQDRGYPPAPGWVDRIYSQKTAAQIVSWYGMYRYAPFGGQGNSNRYQPSGSPVLVYTGDGNPSWRFLETSFGNERSTWRIIEMNAATGAMAVYQPAFPMGIESAVETAFCNAQGTGAGNVRANHLVPEALALHVIDGQLVWMASYEPSQQTDSPPGQQEGDNPDPCPGSTPAEAPVNSPTFTGLGFVPAYNISAANVAYGSTRALALANLQQQLADIATANGATPGAGKTTIAVTGTICAKDTDTSGGNETYYITVCLPGGKPDTHVVYYGQSASLGPAIVLARTGDHVIMQVNKFTITASSQQVTSFSDVQHPVTAAG